MNKIRTLSPFTLIVAFVCLSLVGLALLPQLPVKLSPSHTLPRLTVSFTMPGNASRVIEERTDRQRVHYTGVDSKLKREIEQKKRGMSMRM